LKYHPTKEISMDYAHVLLFSALAFAAPAWGQSPPLLFDFSRVQHKPSEVTTPDKQEVPAGTVALVDGRFGKACKVSFVASTGPQFFTAWVNPTENWDQYEGFSFWVKGDGSKSYGGLEFIDGNDYALRFGYCFPIESTEWFKVSVPWSDLVPELAAPAVDAKRGFAPSRFRNVWIGKWHYWREYPACSFTIERMTLEKHIDCDAHNYTPQEPGLPRVLAKLKARQPVTMVTMGDSLSDKRHWANREKLWSEELVKKLKATYGSEVTLVNPAIGGTTLSQNVILIPRWLREAPTPDLVIIWFGGNDWDSNVRGLRYKEYLELAVDRVRRVTKGQADVLLMTTCPGFAAWETRHELCVATYEVAQERQTGFVDAATVFHKAGSREEALRRQYWVWDNVHLGPGGHTLIADTVFAAIGSGGAGDLKTAMAASWMKARSARQAAASGETRLSSFEPGQEDLVDQGAGQVVKERASDGEYALRLTSKEQEYPGFSLQDGRPLGLIRENSRVLVDVFNPHDHDVDVQLLVRDPQAKDYNSRYNGSVTVKPGRNTIDLDYTRLPRYATQKNEKPDHIDARQITLLVFFLDQPAGSQPITLFFDNVRLAREATGKIEVRRAADANRPVGQASSLPLPADSQAGSVCHGIKPTRPESASAKTEGMAEGVELLSDFEPGGPDLVQGDGQPVREHATDGEHAFRVESDGQNYLGLRIQEGRALRKFQNYVLLKMDVFNPQQEPVRCTARIDDAASKDYGSRYNGHARRPPQGPVQCRDGRQHAAGDR
jgi:lysophospholipase L1-like esterase